MIQLRISVIHKPGLWYNHDSVTRNDFSEEMRRAHLTNNALNKKDKTYKASAPDHAYTRHCTPTLFNHIHSLGQASNNLISLQDLERRIDSGCMTPSLILTLIWRLMPVGWSLATHFYPYVGDHICRAIASHVAGGQVCDAHRAVRVSNDCICSWRGEAFSSLGSISCS